MNLADNSWISLGGRDESRQDAWDARALGVFVPDKLCKLLSLSLPASLPPAPITTGQSLFITNVMETFMGMSDAHHCVNHQTVHLWSGFMALPAGQRKASAKSLF